jgi:hypothetical protein
MLFTSSCPDDVDVFGDVKEGLKLVEATVTPTRGLQGFVLT